MAVVYPIQKALGQVFSPGSVTLTLPSNPAVGNNLYLIAVGYNAGITPPTGFNLIQANTSDTANNATWIYQHTVQSSDGVNYTVSASNDVRMFVLFEMTPNVVQVIVNHGAASSNGNTISTGSLVAYPDNSNYCRVLCWEWDNRGPNYQSTSQSFASELSSSDFRNASLNSYHAAMVLSGPATQSGAVTLTLDAATNYPVWMDVVFVATGIAIVGRALGTKCYLSGSTYSQSFSQTPTAGNMLVVCFVQDYNNSPSAQNYSHTGYLTGSSISLDIYNKISDGTETQITFTGIGINSGSGIALFFAMELTGFNNPQIGFTGTFPSFSNGQASYPTPTPASSQNDALRFQFLAFNTNSVYPSYSPDKAFDVSRANINLIGANSTSISLSPTYIPPTSPNRNNTVTLTAIYGGVITPSSASMLFMDIYSGAIVMGGGSCVIWLL